MPLFHYLISFGTCDINVVCKPCATIQMPSEKNVECECELWVFKSQFRRVDIHSCTI